MCDLLAPKAVAKTRRLLDWEIAMLLNLLSLNIDLSDSVDLKE